MLYEVTVRQSYVNQTLINRFHYNSAGTPAAVSGSFALISAMGFIPDAVTNDFPTGTLARLWQTVISGNASFVEAEAYAMYDPVDFYTVPFATPVVGVVAGESLEPFAAYGLNTNRVRRDVRRGQKRLGGVPEAGVGSGGVVIAGTLSALNDLAAEMSEVLTYTDEGNTLSFSPVVLAFQSYTTPAGNTAYRPYATLAEQLTHMADGIQWTPKPQIRSQVSRQYGRGV